MNETSISKINLDKSIEPNNREREQIENRLHSNAYNSYNSFKIKVDSRKINPIHVHPVHVSMILKLLKSFN